MSEKQTLVLVISRYELDPNLIPPLKLIIPMLSCLYPVRVFTSLDGQLLGSKQSSIYQQLVKKLQNVNGFCCLTKTLESIIREYDQNTHQRYRVCILGHEKVQWAVVMEFKRRNIVVDTVCGSVQKNNLLVQISYITGGIHRTVKQSTMVRIFQLELGMNSKVRVHWKIDRKQTVQFSLTCCACNAQVTNNFLACSVCLAVYCGDGEGEKKCKKQQVCKVCRYSFD